MVLNHGYAMVDPSFRVSGSANNVTPIAKKVLDEYFSH